MRWQAEMQPALHLCVLARFDLLFLELWMQPWGQPNPEAISFKMFLKTLLWNEVLKFQTFFESDFFTIALGCPRL